MDRCSGRKYCYYAKWISNTFYLVVWNYSNNPMAYNNTALYGDFVASTVTHLFLQAGPTSSPGGNLPMQGRLESRQSSSTYYLRGNFSDFLNRCELGLHEDTDLGAMMIPPANSAGQDTYEL